MNKKTGSKSFLSISRLGTLRENLILSLWISCRTKFTASPGGSCPQDFFKELNSDRRGMSTYRFHLQLYHRKCFYFCPWGRDVVDLTSCLHHLILNPIFMTIKFINVSIFDVVP